MRILLIFPSMEHGMITVKDKKSWRKLIAGYPIITLPHIAALTPNKHSVKIINENFEDGTTFWTDREGICEFVKYDCVRITQDPFENKFDYLVLTKFGEKATNDHR